MSVLKVNNLCKNYSSFSLKNISFSLEPGKITGFIGRNGAGKTTTLKSLLNFIHPDSGSVEFFDKDFANHEFDIKKDIGFVSGGINYYGIKKLKTITNTTKRFYDNWDEKAYEYYMSLFKLIDTKTPKQLSEGMKVKYSLVLALSHNAKLLILDEPTSGLDPISRDELLDIFMDLCEKGITIFFSTHITSDLDKCADNIIYIKNGQIIADNEINKFIDSYRLVTYDKNELNDTLSSKIIGSKKTKNSMSGLIKKEDASLFDNKCSIPDLEEIMIHIEKEIM